MELDKPKTSIRPPDRFNYHIVLAASENGSHFISLVLCFRAKERGLISKERMGQLGHFVREGSLEGNSQCLAFWNRVVIKEGIVSGSWGYGQPSLFILFNLTSPHLHIFNPE